MRQSIEIEVPCGYELTGEYRAPQLDEHYLNWSGHAQQHSGNASMKYTRCHLILRKTRPDAPAGFKLTGEYRVIRKGDWYVSNLSENAVYQHTDPVATHVRWILTPDRPAALEGFEYTEEFRDPAVGEHFLNLTGKVCFCRGCWASGDPRWILRKVTTTKDWWPKWLKAGWVAKGDDDLWYAFKGLPTRRSRFWATHDDARLLDPAFCGIQFPDVSWEDSLFENPWNDQ